MALSAFGDKSVPPAEPALRKTLGRTAALWMDLKRDLAAAHGPLVEEWNFAGNAYGWSLRLKQKKRAIVYMTPCDGYFLASLALGEKACAAARDQGLPAPLLAIIDAAPKYAEGRGIRIPVRSRNDLRKVKDLAAVKVAN
ncbi:MAG TPA: DUF3788 domain-containing protein [Vicinamibacterales bacterium]|nr:DUF3788 domain-containing protein [Vicinamibacterales bacterium]